MKNTSDMIEKYLKELLSQAAEIEIRRSEIAEHFGVKDPKFFAKKHIKPLLESGALRMTIPNKPTSPAQKYVTVERHG